MRIPSLWSPRHGCQETRAQRTRLLCHACDTVRHTWKRSASLPSPKQGFSRGRPQAHGARLAHSLCGGPSLVAVTEANAPSSIARAHAVAHRKRKNTLSDVSPESRKSYLLEGL
eukprot:jgi/Mesvir1/1867/Mv25215-RA.1